MKCSTTSMLIQIWIFTIGLESKVDNKKLKILKYYNNRFLKFFNERLRSKPKIRSKKILYRIMTKLFSVKKKGN